MLANINEGISNETRVLNEKLTEVKSAIESANLPKMLANINEGISNETRVLNEKLSEIKLAIGGATQTADMRLHIKPLSGNDLFSALPPAGDEGGALPENLPALPLPEVDLEASDPVGVITAATEYEQCAQMLSALATGLISAHGRALLYSLIRMMKPSLVVEIGSYQAGTSKVICWALAANGQGRLHTIDPFGGDRVPGILASWPAPLRKFVRYFPVNSMEYFAALSESGERPDLIFVDGNHDYEFALFDIEAAARAISPGGFVVVDNTSQAGPFLAAQDFLKSHADWRECGGPSLAKTITDSPFEVRSAIRETDFCVLRAPKTTYFTGHPFTSGQLHWERTSLKSIRLNVLDGAPGILYAQCVLRTFGRGTSLGEFPCKGSDEIENPGEIAIELNFQLDEDAAEQAVRFTVEPWFVWVGVRPLAVASWAVT
jgi:predicted O-methyltransferase YrrM